MDRISGVTFNKSPAINSFYEDGMKELLAEIARYDEQSYRVVESKKDTEAGIHYLHGFMLGGLSNLKNIIEITMQMGSELKEVVI